MRNKYPRFLLAIVWNKAQYLSTHAYRYHITNTLAHAHDKRVSACTCTYTAEMHVSKINIWTWRAYTSTPRNHRNCRRTAKALKDMFSLRNLLSSFALLGLMHLSHVGGICSTRVYLWGRRCPFACEFRHMPASMHQLASTYTDVLVRYRASDFLTEWIEERFSWWTHAVPSIISGSVHSTSYRLLATLKVYRSMRGTGQVSSCSLVYIYYGVVVWYDNLFWGLDLHTHASKNCFITWRPLLSMSACCRHTHVRDCDDCVSSECGSWYFGVIVSLCMFRAVVHVSCSLQMQEKCLSWFISV